MSLAHNARLAAILVAQSGERNLPSFAHHVSEVGRALLELFPGATLHQGVAHPEDPLPALLANSGPMAPIDAVIEITLPEAEPVQRLCGMPKRLAAVLATCFDLERSVVVVGKAYTLIPGRAPTYMAAAACRDNLIDVATLLRWWLKEHAPLMHEVVRPLYHEFLVVDPTLSQRASLALNTTSASFDVFERIGVAEIDDLLKAFTTPEIAHRLDTAGYLSSTDFRAAFMKPA